VSSAPVHFNIKILFVVADTLPGFSFLRFSFQMFGTKADYSGHGLSCFTSDSTFNCWFSNLKL
jgi:hypothetical protein